MARLIVEALAEDTLAAPGNRQPNWIVVSVTDWQGNPVTGLDETNFKVDALIVSPLAREGGAPLDITGTMPGRLPGFYLIGVVPTLREQMWEKGVYIFTAAVERGDDRGQALASVLMD
jgi:hypothetical protein